MWYQILTPLFIKTALKKSTFAKFYRKASSNSSLAAEQPINIERVLPPAARTAPLKGPSSPLREPSLNSSVRAAPPPTNIQPAPVVTAARQPESPSVVVNSGGEKPTSPQPHKATPGKVFKAISEIELREAMVPVQGSPKNGVHSTPMDRKPAEWQPTKSALYNRSPAATVTAVKREAGIIRMSRSDGFLALEKKTRRASVHWHPSIPLPPIDLAQLPSQEYLNLVLGKSHPSPQKKPSPSFVSPRVSPSSKHSPTKPLVFPTFSSARF